MAEETLNVREPDPKWSRQERNAFLDFRDHHQLHSVIKEDGSALSVQFDNREIIATRRDDGGIDFWADSHKPQNGEYSETNNDRITDLDDNQGLKLWCSHYFSTHEKLALKEADARVSWTKVNDDGSIDLRYLDTDDKAHDLIARRKAGSEDEFDFFSPHLNPQTGKYEVAVEFEKDAFSLGLQLYCRKRYAEWYAEQQRAKAQQQANPEQDLAGLRKTAQDTAAENEDLRERIRQQQQAEAAPKTGEKSEHNAEHAPGTAGLSVEERLDRIERNQREIMAQLDRIEQNQTSFFKKLETKIAKVLLNWAGKVKDAGAHTADQLDNFAEDRFRASGKAQAAWNRMTGKEPFAEYSANPEPSQGQQQTSGDQSVQKEIAALKAQIKELQKENAELRAKLAELQKGKGPQMQDPLKNAPRPEKTGAPEDKGPAVKDQKPAEKPRDEYKEQLIETKNKLEKKFGSWEPGSFKKHLEAQYGSLDSIKRVVQDGMESKELANDLRTLNAMIRTHMYQPSADERKFSEFVDKTWTERVDAGLQKAGETFAKDMKDHMPPEVGGRGIPIPPRDAGSGKSKDDEGWQMVNPDDQSRPQSQPQKDPQPEPKADPEAQKKAAINKALDELRAVPYGKPGNGAWLKYLEAVWGPESTIRDMVAHRAGDGKFYQDLHQFRDVISTNFYKPSAHELQFLEFLGKTWNNPDIEKVVDNLRQQQATQEHEPKAADPKSAPEPESKNVQQPSKTEPQKAEPAAPEHTQTEAKSEKFLLNPITGKKVALPDRALNSPDPDVLSRINDGKLFRAQDLAVAITYARLKANNRNLDEGTFKRTISDAGFAVNEALAKEAIAIPCAVKNGKEGTDYYFSTKDLDLRQLQTGKYKLNSKALQYLESMMNGAENTNALTLEQKSIQNDMRKYLNERNVAGDDAKSRMMSFYEYGSKAINTVLTNGADEVIKKNRFTVNENGQLMHLDEARRLEQQKTQQAQQAQQHQQGARV